MPRRSRLTRTLGCLTALLTVWCLGCSAFDPLIASLFPESGRMMVCAGDAPVSAIQTATQDEQAASIAAADSDGDGAACDCGSCYAPAPAALAVASPPGPLPQQPAAEPGLPPSFERAPLVPPPQRSA